MNNTITKKDLIEILKQYPDETPIIAEYRGDYDSMFDKGDCFRVNDINCTDKAIYLEFK